MGAILDFISILTTNIGAGVLLLICGAVWVLDTVYENSRREGFFKKNDGWNFDMTTLLKVLSIIACCSGFIFILVGILGYFNPNITKTLTCTSLIIMGLLTVLKPVNDLPIASIIGFLSSSLVALIIALIFYFTPLEAASISWQWGLAIIIILVIVFIVSALIANFWLIGPKFVSKIVSYPFVSVIGAAYCFILGGLVLGGIYI
ncbi:MAG: hypothetical protein ACFFBP_20485 [Promethearchaeota archaeon]